MQDLIPGANLRPYAGPLSPDLNPILYRKLVEAALEEDLGRGGDITTEALVPADAMAVAEIRSRATGIVAGLPAALYAFFVLDPRMEIEVFANDGRSVGAGETLVRLRGSARALLSAERTALNLLGRLCGIATATQTLVRLISHTAARVVDTRKTTPGLRALEKYAVRCGGGQNHRLGLDDMILIKDNHLVMAGGHLVEAVARARQRVGHTVKIEVEVDTLDQLRQLLNTDADIVLLDNMKPETLAEAVALVNRKMLTEASGNVNARTIAGIAETGVDLISVGALTHSVPNFDVGLDFL